MIKDIKMKLAFAVLYLGRSGMEVLVDDASGKRRHCQLTWSKKTPTDVPPIDWPAQVVSELNYQDSDRTAFIP